VQIYSAVTLPAKTPAESQSEEPRFAELRLRFRRPEEVEHGVVETLRFFDFPEMTRFIQRDEVILSGKARLAAA